MSKSNPTLTVESQLSTLRASGFEVRSLEAGRWRVEKGRCAALLEAGPEGLRLAAQTPGYLIGDEIGYLVDGGYQKFLSVPGRELPATAERLREIHAFEEQLRAAVGLTSLYNQSLGTVSERYRYDRLKGRET